MVFSWMSGVANASVFTILYTLLAVWFLQKVLRTSYDLIRRRLYSTPLYGPPRHSLIWGVNRMLMTSPDRISILEQWMSKYGAVYKIPAPLGKEVVVFGDPKAIAHVYGRETYGYNQTSFARSAIEQLVCI